MELVSATRTLFDERGMQDAPIEEIARTVGTARGLVYRHFSSMDELYALTVTSFLEELEGVLSAAISPGAGAADRIEQWARAYAQFVTPLDDHVDSFSEVSVWGLWWVKGCEP
jgi:AcrR family transcriptional regulator